MENRRQLLIDVSRIVEQDAKSGIQRVVRGAWAGLVEAAGAHWDIRPVFATSTDDYSYAPADILLLKSHNTPGQQIFVQPGDVFLALDLSPRTLTKYEKQIANWRKSGVHVCVVLYDLLPVTHPHWFNRRTVRNFRKWLATVERLADRVLCISDNAAEAAQAYWRRPRLRWFNRGARLPVLATFPLGWNIEETLPSMGTSDAGSAVLAWAERAPTVLMVGTVEPRKGHSEVLAAFEHLWAQTNARRLQLLIVGQPGWKTFRLQRYLRHHPECGRRLTWCLDASDMQLLQMYRKCIGVLVASKAEGFGLPVAEALINRRPVLARKLPVFDMFAGPNLTTFDDDAPAALAASISRWIESASAQDFGPQPEQAMTWKDTANHILAILEENVPSP